MDQVFKVGSSNSARADVQSSNHESTGSSDTTGQMVPLGKGGEKDCGTGPLILVVHLVSVNEAGIMNPLNETGLGDAQVYRALFPAALKMSVN